MIETTILLKDPRWKKALRPYCKTVEHIVLHCEARASKFPHDVAIVLADDVFIRELNGQYRGKNKPTNVLSFPNEDAPLGDVILAYDTIAREAEEQGKSFRDHATHLIVHGVLHLMGHDHEVKKEAEKMEAQEIKILKKLGVGNPYL